MLRLTLYYTIHTTWNQLRKLFKTWMFLIVLGAVLGGGLIGFGIARFSDNVAELQQESGETVIPEDFMEYFEASNLSAADAAELGAGIMILAIFTLQILGAEKSVSRLFLPADVNFLFASDKSPQEVLSFRLLTTLGTAVVASVYLFFQLPSLVLKFGISPFAAFSILVTWCLLLGYSIVLKTLVFEVGSNQPFFKKNLRFILAGVYAAMILSLYLSYKNSAEQVFLLSAHRFFNAPASRWIPIWGWLKGIVAFALEGNMQASVILMVLSLVLLVVLAVVIRVMPLDYYEEATIRTEEIALYMESVNSEQAGLLVTRPKHHSQDLERDGFHYGNGASVYFFKTMYNRFRFARFGLVTRTMMTYLLIAAGGGLFVRMFMDEPSIYPPVLILAVMVFFRTIMSPMSEDIHRDSFIMIPENTWLKLLYSQLGGSVNCALDIVIPLMAGTAIAGFSPLRGLLFLPLVVSVDYFATTAGTFVDVSIPSSVDKTFKQVLQILLLYFGLIGDEMILAIGFSSRHAVAGMVLTGLANVFLGSLFFGLTGVILNPAKGIPVKDQKYVPDETHAQQTAGRIGFALTMMYLAILAAQIGLNGYVSLHTPENEWAQVLSVYLPIYLIGAPVYWFFTHSLRQERIQETHLTTGQVLCYLPVCFFLMYTGSFLGLIVSGLLSSLIHLPWLPEVIHADAAISSPLSVLFLVVLSPLMEELIFRRSVIDRMRTYGETPALLFSALLFGLFHGNFRQVFYAFFLGLVFGYVYLKTGKLRYSLCMHMIINALGTVLAPAMISMVTSAFPQTPLYEVSLQEVLFQPAVLIFLLYLALLIGLSMLGAVLFVYFMKEKELSANGVEMRVLFRSPGMIMFVILMTAVFVLSLA